jgi:ethanolamine ammonia-lyase large subunit
MKQLYFHNDKAYLIIRRVLESHFYGKGNSPQLEYVQMYRDWCGADHVLRDQTHYMFCETIEDVEFEEINNDSAIQTQQS